MKVNWRQLLLVALVAMVMGMAGGALWPPVQGWVGIRINADERAAQEYREKVRIRDQREYQKQEQKRQIEECISSWNFGGC